MHERRGVTINPKTTARDAVQSELRARIVMSDLAPGEAIDEKAIAAELGLSRTPVHEAVLRLADEGLVQVFPRMGTFVTRISIERVTTSQFVREAIELASYRDAVVRRTAEDLEWIEAVLKAQDAAVRSHDVGRFLSLDDDFHRALMAAGGHDAAWPQASAAKLHMDRARALSLPRPHVLEHLRDEHRDIARALAGADAEGGQEVLRHHLRHVFADVAAIRAEHPDLFVESDQPAPRRTVTTVM